jgi:predicted transcriptional regulator
MSDDSKIKSDYEYSRDTYYELIDKGKDALENMIEVARESEHPRAYEVLSTLMKNVSDINDKLMDLNKKNKDINKEDVKQLAGTTNNNIFLGSTADLQKLLNDENDIVDVTPE